MKRKILSILVATLLLTTILASIGVATQTCNTSTGSITTSEVPVELHKFIDIDGELVNDIEVYQGSSIRYNISIMYHDTDGPPPDGSCFKIRDILIKDFLPEGLEFNGNVAYIHNGNEYTIGVDQTIEDNTVTWDLGRLELNDTEWFAVEYDALVTGLGELTNLVNVTALEKCCNIPRAVETTATITSIQESPNYVTKDVDEDGNNEYAIDEDADSSNGYEVYDDPDESSDEMLSKDGDEDGKIDHFIDTDLDGELPEVYWDPDINISTPITNRDVDYDGTIEWIYDNDGVDGLDHYYDPDDDMIYDYIVYTLTIYIVGEGIVEVDPDGTLFLPGWEVNLTANALLGSDWEFENWTGDASGTDPQITIIMDSDKTVTANFNYTGDDDDEGPSVEIIKPKENWLYKFSIPIRKRDEGTKIVGPIVVKAKVTKDDEVVADEDIEKVEFYLDDELQRTDDKAPYTWLWLTKPKDDKKQYTIKVVAYDKMGLDNSTEITVERDNWKPVRDHPIIAALLGLLLLRALKNRFGGDTNETDEPDEDDGIDDDNANTPKADAKGPYFGVVGEIILFDGSNSEDPNDDALIYIWDFGDGSSGEGKTVEHSYDEPGDYTVTLTVEDETGLTDTYKATVTIDDKQDSDIVENDLFLYIVTGLALVLLSLIGGIFTGRKYYV